MCVFLLLIFVKIQNYFSNKHTLIFEFKFIIWSLYLLARKVWSLFIAFLVLSTEIWWIKASPPSSLAGVELSVSRWQCLWGPQHIPAGMLSCPLRHSCSSTGYNLLWSLNNSKLKTKQNCRLVSGSADPAFTGNREKFPMLKRQEVQISCWDSNPVCWDRRPVSYYLRHHWIVFFIIICFWFLK